MTHAPSDALRARFEASLARLSEASRLRTLDRAPEGLGPGGRLVDFSSNDYLGLRHDARLVEAGARAARLHGAGTGSSRAVLASDLGVFAFEERVAALAGWEGATLFPSGFLANLALFDTLGAFDFEAPGELEILLDSRAHASLFAGARLCGASLRYFPHGDHGALARALGRSSAAHKVVVVESLHSMDGDFEDLASVVRVAREQGASIVVDEAHSFGVTGPCGMGAVAALPPEDRSCVIAVMLGLGKAMGVSGGVVVSPAWFQERLRQKARPFLFSTGGAPFVAGALGAALGIVASREGDALRARLESNVTRLRAGLAEAGLEVLGAPGSPIGAIVRGDDARALAGSAALRERGYLVKAIRPPTVPCGTSRLRLICHASHSPSQLDGLCSATTSLP